MKEDDTWLIESREVYFEICNFMRSLTKRREGGNYQR